MKFILSLSLIWIMLLNCIAANDNTTVWEAQANVKSGFSGDFFKSSMKKRLILYFENLMKLDKASHIPSVCRVWFNADDGNIYVLLLNPAILIRFDKGLITEDERFVTTWGGTWDLNKDVEEKNSGSSRFELLKPEAQALVYGCIVSGDEIFLTGNK